MTALVPLDPSEVMAQHNGWGDGNDYERGLLGAILSGYRDIPTLARMVTGTDFYRPEHEAIWEAAVALHAAGTRPDRSRCEPRWAAPRSVSNRPHVPDRPGQRIRVRNRPAVPRRPSP